MTRTLTLRPGQITLIKRALRYFIQAERLALQEATKAKGGASAQRTREAMDAVRAALDLIDQL